MSQLMKISTAEKYNDLLSDRYWDAGTAVSSVEWFEGVPQQHASWVWYKIERETEFLSPECSMEALQINNEFASLSGFDALDDIRGVVRSFDHLVDGWDGPDSRGALEGVVQDALEVLQNWLDDMETPEPVLAFDGSISLELYDDDGFTKGGIELIGGHKAVFTVISRSRVIDSGTFNTISSREIIQTITKMRRALLTSNQ
jgi:hypothetical protein